MGRIFMIVAGSLIVLTLAKWTYDSGRYGELVYYTKTSKITKFKEVDPLFGTTIEKSITEKGNWLGLLDVEFPFGALPLCSVWTAVGIFGFVLYRRQQKLFRGLQIPK